MEEKKRNMQEQDRQAAALRLKPMNKHKWGEGMLLPLLPHQKEERKTNKKTKKEEKEKVRQ